MLRYILTFLLFTILTISADKSIAAEKIKIAILPWKVNADEGMKYLKSAVNDMLASRIGAEPVVEIIKESSIKQVISRHDKEEIAEDTVKNIGKEVGADYIIYGSITVIADSVSIDARTIALKKSVPPVFFASQRKGLENVITLVDEMARDAKIRILTAEGIITASTVPGEPSPAYTGKFVTKEKPAEAATADDFIITESVKTKGVWKSPQLDATVKYISIADVDKDGKNELIVLYSHDLSIYRLKGQSLELIKEIKGDVSVKNYSVSTADTNNNGTPEIYVTRMVNERLSSYVLEYRDKEFQTISSDLKWFIKVFEEPHGANTVMGQKYSDTSGFFGQVQRFEWKDSKLQELSVFDLPKNLNLYSFEMTDFDKDGKVDIIALDERDYIRIYNKDSSGQWKQTWKSGDFYGGSLNRLELGATSTSHDASDFMDIKARILYADFDGDGIREIIISRNDPGTVGRYMKVVRSYDSSEIINLAWDGYNLEENWKTKKIDGYIADYAVNDTDNDGQKELVIAVVLEGGTGKSYIMAYKLKER